MVGYYQCEKVGFSFKKIPFKPIKVVLSEQPGISRNKSDIILWVAIPGDFLVWRHTSNPSIPSKALSTWQALKLDGKTVAARMKLVLISNVIAPTARNGMLAPRASDIWLQLLRTGQHFLGKWKLHKILQKPDEREGYSSYIGQYRHSAFHKKNDWN